MLKFYAQKKYNKHNQKTDKETRKNFSNMYDKGLISYLYN